MIRKVLIGVGAATLLGMFFLGRDAWSYVRTTAGYLKDSVHNSVPVEFQLQRARQMIKDLVPEVQKNMHLIAKEEVEVQRLDAQITDSEAKLAKEKDQLTTLKTAVLSGKSHYEFGGRTYSLELVKQDMANRFDRYKTSDATLASLRQIHDARQKSLEAARQKLEGMLSARRQLQVEVENLEARNEMLAAARTTSNYQFDETQLGRLKELISNLKTRMAVDERLVNSDEYYHEEIPVDKAAPNDVVDQITKYFQDGKPAATDVARHE